MLRSRRLLLFACVLVGCGALNELTVFDLPVEFQVVIPSTLNVGLPLDVVTPDIESNATARFDTEGTRADLVEEVLLTEMVLTLTAPAGGDFGFLEQLDVYIEAEGLEEKLLATSGVVSAEAGSTLDLVCSQTDFKNYIATEAFDIRVRAVTDELTTQDVSVDVDCVFRIDAQLIPD
jgi:hypothetical protein